MRPITNEMRVIALLASAALVWVASCARKTPVQTVPPQTTPVSSVAPAFADPTLNPLIWFQTSAEYVGLAHQAYNVAAERLVAALSDRSVSALPAPPPGYEALPPAIITDLDETGIDNSFYNAGLLVAREPHSAERWQKWVQEERAQLIPGAGEFFALARTRGVKVFYITNRRVTDAPSTLKNLQRLGLQVDPAHAELLAREDQISKEPRRRHVAKTHRVLLLLGDNNGDFDRSFDSPNAGERREASVRARERWGRTWIALPNPIYGDWERVITGGETGEGAIKKKLEALKTMPR